MTSSIRQILSGLVEEAKARTAYLQAELADLQEQKLEIETRLAATQLALVNTANAERLSNAALIDLSHAFGANPFCPRCRILDGLESAVTALTSEGRDDLFRCDVCHFKFPVSV